MDPYFNLKFSFFRFWTSINCLKLVCAILTLLQNSTWFWTNLNGERLEFGNYQILFTHGITFKSTNLFTTLEPPKYSNSPNLLLWFFCLIKSRANCSGITKPFLNPNLICASNCLLQNHLENWNSNILEVPMSPTS